MSETQECPGSRPMTTTRLPLASARSTVGVVADELGPSLRWATATTTRATRTSRQ
jgi:hypothetical protein